MLNKEKITQWLIKNCTNEFGEIDLSNLDFGDRDILLNGIKTKGTIYNVGQCGTKIRNERQQAKEIDNSEQKARKSIDNGSQQAIIIIINEYQKAYVIK